MLRLLVVDDHPIFADAFTLMAAKARPDCIVNCVTSITEAEALIGSGRHYDLVFLDLSMPGADGFSVLIHLKKARPNLRVVIVSAREDSHTVSMAHAFGASGYLGKSLPFEDMQQQLRRVLEGESVFPPTTQPITDTEAAMRHRIEGLSAAQFRVLCALCKGEPNKHIAESLDLSEATVKSHLAAIYRGLGVVNRAQAILAAQPLLRQEGREPGKTADPSK